MRKDFRGLKVACIQKMVMVSLVCLDGVGRRMQRQNGFTIVDHEYSSGAVIGLVLALSWGVDGQDWCARTICQCWGAVLAIQYSSEAAIHTHLGYF